MSQFIRMNDKDSGESEFFSYVADFPKQTGHLFEMNGKPSFKMGRKKIWLK